MLKEEKISLLTEVSELYYIKNMTQADIANKLFISRTSVSRLLKQAVEQGIVEIKINHYLTRNYHIEEMLKKQYGLKGARVMCGSNGDHDELLHCLGKTACDYINGKLKTGMTLGISWGDSVKTIVESLDGSGAEKINVVQIMGSTAYEIESNSAQRLVRRVADLYKGEAYYLSAPLYVEDDYVCEMLRNNPAVSITLKMAASADIILTGIGVGDISKRQDNSETYVGWMDYFDDEMIQEIKDKHAVGSLAGQFFDIDGNPIDCRWSRHCIGIQLQEIKRIKDVIAVAVGKSKVQAIKGALNGAYVTGLITDLDTASELLKKD